MNSRNQALIPPLRIRTFYSFLGLLICFFGIEQCSFAQTHLINQGGKLVVQADSYVQVSGDVKHQSIQGINAQTMLGGEIALKGDWINEATSSSIIFPTHPEGRVRFHGSQQAQMVGGTSPSRFAWLVLDNPSGLQLHQESILTDRLSLWNGKLDASLFPLVISNPAPGLIDSVSSNRYIIGHLRRYVGIDHYELPIGTAEYPEFVSMSIHQASNLPYVDVHFVDNPLPIPEALFHEGARIQRFLDAGYWQLEAPFGYQATFDVHLRSQGHQNGGADPRQHAIFTRTSNQWESVGLHDNSSQYGSGSDEIRTSRTQLQQLGDFAIGVGEYVLSSDSEVEPMFSHFSVGGNGGGNGALNVRFSAQEASSYSLRLMDLQGKLLSQQQGMAQAGMNQIDLDLSSYAKGVYLLQLEREGESHRIKVW